MSDGTNRTEPNELPPLAEPNRTEPGTETCNIKQAAQSLGIGERAVLKRIDEGKLRAYREGREWRLYLPLDAISEPNRTVKRTEPNEPAERTATLEVEKQVHPLEDVVRRQDAEISYLRSELTAQREQHALETARRDEADGEFRRLLLRQDAEIAQLQERVQLLLAAPPDGPAKNAQEDVPAPRTERETANAGISVQGTEGTVGKPSDRKWWRFWER